MRLSLSSPSHPPAIAASQQAGPARPVAIKRIGRLRLNWFFLGAAFGIGASFFLSFLHAALILPPWDALPPVRIVDSAQAALPAPDAALPALAQPAAQTASAPAPAPEAVAVTYPQTLALTLRRGDTIRDLLVAHRVPAAEAEKVAAMLRPKLKAQALGAGQKISVTLARHETVGDMAAVRDLAIKLPNFSTIELERLREGEFTVAARKELLTARAYRGFGIVRRSLAQAGADAHIPASVMAELVKAYSYDIDFQRDIHPGDTIEVLMERKTAADGRVGGYGAVRYAALTLRGRKYELCAFKGPDGALAWYDGQGNSVKKSLLRTPLDAAHITSGFGMRTHPILGYSRMHKGVDFGAATGTPIMAAGTGTVEFKGWKSGYGNFVVLRHNAKYETAYGHISRFAAIRVGQKVRQGQVIAYVGMTGAATGPHLHYEVRENEVQVNPVAKQFNMNTGLGGRQLAAFKAAKQSALRELASLARDPRDRLASR